MRNRQPDHNWAAPLPDPEEMHTVSKVWFPRTRERLWQRRHLYHSTEHWSTFPNRGRALQCGWTCWTCADADRKDSMYRC